jgi:tRNA dimethylallyltransferase
VSKPLIVIVGPTASGKTALAMEIARRFNGEIICADSRTVYKGLDIGTAKPSAADRLAIPHHLLDVVTPNQHFSAAEFKQLAERSIIDIRKRGKLPILVGGTGLYIDAVIFDYKFGAVADPGIRAELEKKTTKELQDICREKNIKLPTNFNNRRHLIRAIELGGLIKSPRVMISDTIVVGISPTKEILSDRIRRRTKDMFDKNLLHEAQTIAAQYGWENEAMTGNIYQIAKQVLGKDIDVDTATEMVIKSDLNLAKRQMTWFRRNPAIQWSSDPQVLITKIDQFIASKK